MHRAEIECYETYNLWSLRFKKRLLMLVASFFKNLCVRVINVWFLERMENEIRCITLVFAKF